MRYWNIVSSFGKLERRGRFPEVKHKKYRQERGFWVDDRAFSGNLDVLNVVLNGSCASEDIVPTFDMVENCE